MMSKRRSTLIFVVFTILIAPTANASSSGMNFIDTTMATATDAYTNSVTISPDGTLIASSYDTFVELHNATSLEIIQRFDLGREVFHIDFSPDGQYLGATTLAIESIPDSVKIIDIAEMEVKSEQARGNNRPSNIDWSPNGDMILVANMNNGALVLNSSHLGEVMALNGMHTSDVTCVGFSDSGNYIITGDELGKVQLWDEDGEPITTDINVNEEITGCDFSNSDAKFAVGTTSGNIFSYAISGLPLQSIDSGENHGIMWSTSEDILYVLESDSTPELIALDGSTFNQLHSTKLVHKALDFTIVESNGMLTDFYVATDANHIAIYGTPTYPDGYGAMGSDLDGDNIPDTLDLDDDGDSIQDDWDFNCFNSTLCSRDPDLQTIRKMIVNVAGNTIIVEDIYTMSQSDTYTFRNLSRRSIISDQRISYEETNMVENAFCNNMDKNDYIQKLRNSLELSVGQINNGTMQCEILSGLSFTKTFDKEQVKFSFKTVFDVAPNISLPVTLFLIEQISVSDSSITHLVESHPILLNHLTIEGEILTTLWWNEQDLQTPELNFTAVVTEESQINSLVESIVENLFIIVVVSLSLVIIVWILIRRRNLNSLILDDTEFDDVDNDEENFYSDDSHEFDANEYSKPKPIVDSDYVSKQVEDSPILTENIPSEERPTDRRAFTLNDDAEMVDKQGVKRRSGRINRNAQGPIMSTKRKRLDGKLDIPGEKIISGKKPITKASKRPQSVKKVRRVRSVKKDD